MRFLRHIGKQGDRKVAIVFREVPGEPHMCLATYTETLGHNIHDPMMACIESDIGQNSENLADALNRNFTRDGRSLLQVLHKEGLMKKVQTESIVMTPTPTTKIKLSELNKILDEMQKGEAAVQKLAEMDNSAGLQIPADVARRMRGNKDARVDAPVTSATDALGDSSLAKQRLEQAAKMEREAKGLLAESKRLMEEAKALDPSVVSAENQTAPAIQPPKKKRASRAKVAI